MIPLHSMAPGAGGAEDATMAGQLAVSVRDPWSCERLFDFHYDTIRRASARARVEGFLLFACLGNHRLESVVAVDADDERASSHAVVGRHRNADLPLCRDPTVALRHLLVHATRGPGGRPWARVLDLKTTRGVQVEGLGPCRSCVTTGPLVVRVGAYALMLIPTGVSWHWPRDATHAWRSLSSSSIVQAPAGDPSFVDWASHADPGGQPEEVRGVLSLVHGRDILVHAVTRRELSSGLVLGRYARCELRAGAIRSAGWVSRVHALLTDDHGMPTLFDLASTNGTRVDGVFASKMRLGPTSAIELAPGLTLHWESSARRDVTPQLRSPRPSPARTTPTCELAETQVPKRWRGPAAWGFSVCALAGAAALAAVFVGAGPAVPRVDPRGGDRPQGATPEAASAPSGTAPATSPRPERPQFVPMLPRAAGPPPPPPDHTSLPAELESILAAADRAAARGVADGRPCIDPVEVFGHDSPDLRLFLYAHRPTICFEYKYCPELEEP